MESQRTQCSVYLQSSLLEWNLSINNPVVNIISFRVSTKNTSHTISRRWHEREADSFCRDAKNAHPGSVVTPGPRIWLGKPFLFELGLYKPCSDLPLSRRQLAMYFDLFMAIIRWVQPSGMYRTLSKSAIDYVLWLVSRSILEIWEVTKALHTSYTYTRTLKNMNTNLLEWKSSANNRDVWFFSCERSSA